MNAPVNRVGQRFGRWTVLKWAGNRRWLCRCDCGTERLQATHSLTSGHTNGCPKCRANTTPIKHGGRHTPLYAVWSAMINRCENPNDKGWERYGGRGIRLCKTWREDFGTFQAWSAANGYRKGLSLDRINNDAGYSPDNCRWTTAKVQNLNQRRTHRVEIDGRLITLSELSERHGMSWDVLYGRLVRKRWPVSRALSEPVHPPVNKRLAQREALTRLRRSIRQSKD